MSDACGRGHRRAKTVQSRCLKWSEVVGRDGRDGSCGHWVDERTRVRAHFYCRARAHYSLLSLCGITGVTS